MAKIKSSKYSVVRMILSTSFFNEERQAIKELAHKKKISVSSYLRGLVQADYQRKVKNFNPELFEAFEIGGDYSTGNPKFVEAMKNRDARRKARNQERKTNDDKL